MLYEGVNKDDKDFTALISKIRQARADLVFWGGLHDAGGLIVRQMRAQGVKAPLMGGDGITDDEFAAIAGPGAEGTLMTFSPDPRTNPDQQEDHRAVPLTAHVRAAGLHALQLRLGADHQAGGREGEIARSRRRSPKVMRSGMVFNTVLGDLSFDKKGDVVGDGYVVDGVKKERYVLYDVAQGSGRPHHLFRSEQLRFWTDSAAAPQPGVAAFAIRSTAAPGRSRSARC